MGRTYVGDATVEDREPLGEACQGFGGQAVEELVALGDPERADSQDGAADHLVDQQVRVHEISAQLGGVQERLHRLDRAS